MNPVPLEDGTLPEPLSSTEAVHYVLSGASSVKKRKPTFLMNIGMHPCSAKPTKAQLASELESERAGKDKLLSTIEELAAAKAKAEEKAEEDRKKAEEDRQKYLRELQAMRIIQVFLSPLTCRRITHQHLRRLR